MSINPSSLSDNPAVPATLSAADQLKQAWAYHISGSNAQALPLFEALVTADPTHIDATYGLALTLRKLEQRDRAVSTFQQVAKLVAARANEQANDDEDSRYRMLARMIEQQLGQLDAGQP